MAKSMVPIAATVTNLHHRTCGGSLLKSRAGGIVVVLFKVRPQIVNTKKTHPLRKTMATHQQVAECSAALADATSAQKEAMTQMKGLRDTKARCHDELLTAMKQAGIESVELPSGEPLHIEERLRVAKRGSN